MASAAKIRSVRIRLNVEPKDLKQQKLCVQAVEGTQTIVRLTLVINRWKKKNLCKRYFTIERVSELILSSNNSY